MSTPGPYKPVAASLWLGHSVFMTKHHIHRLGVLSILTTATTLVHLRPLRWGRGESRRHRFYRTLFSAGACYWRRWRKISSRIMTSDACTPLAKFCSRVPCEVFSWSRACQRYKTPVPLSREPNVPHRQIVILPLWVTWKSNVLIYAWFTTLGLPCFLDKRDKTGFTSALFTKTTSKLLRRHRHVTKFPSRYWSCWFVFYMFYRVHASRSG